MTKASARKTAASDNQPDKNQSNDNDEATRPTSPDSDPEKSSASAVRGTDAADEANPGEEGEHRAEQAQRRTGDSDEGGEQGQRRTADSGPGTGQDAPAEESARPPATTVNTEATASGPLEAPTDARLQTVPEGGLSLSTTDPVYAANGGRTIAGEDFVRLVDADGNELSADDLFDDGDGSKTWVVAKTRVYEVFYYPNTTEEAKRLMFAQGRRVPRGQAEQIKAALQNAPEPAVVADGRLGERGDGAPNGNNDDD